MVAAAAAVARGSGGAGAAGGAGASWSMRMRMMLDTSSSWVPNMKKVKRDVTDTKIKGQDMGEVFKRVGDSMKLLTASAIGLGVALVGLLTAGIAMSPQFQAGWARLQPVFTQLVHYLGQKFQPAIEALVGFITKVVYKIIEIGEKTGLFDALSNAITKAVNAASSLFGWLDKIGAIEGLAIVVTFIIEGITGAAGWLIDVLRGGETIPTPTTLMLDWIINLIPRWGEPGGFSGERVGGAGGGAGGGGGGAGEGGGGRMTFEPIEIILSIPELGTKFFERSILASQSGYQ